MPIDETAKISVTLTRGQWIDIYTVLDDLRDCAKYGDTLANTTRYLEERGIALDETVTSLEAQLPDNE